MQTNLYQETRYPRIAATGGTPGTARERSRIGFVREARPTPSRPPQSLAESLTQAARDLRVAEAHTAREQARWLGSAHTHRLYIHHGFASFSDWAREQLSLEPRTARRRVALHRTLADSPPLEAALQSGHLSPCQVLLLENPPPSPNPNCNATNYWIQVATKVSVRELHRLLREARRAAAAESLPDDDDHEPTASLDLSVSSPIAVLFNETIELGRRRMGWQAPRHQVFDAMLTETDTALPPMPPHDPSPHQPGDTLSHRSSPPQPADGQNGDTLSHRSNHPQPTDVPQRSNREVAIFPNRAALARAHTALDTVHHELRELARLLRVHPTNLGSGPARADCAVNHLRLLDSQVRPLRVLLAATLVALRDIQADRLLGHLSFSEFVEAHLRMSPRTARNLLRQADDFDAHPQLAWSYESGDLGAGQARLVRPFLRRKNHAAWMHRAATVTNAQLEREVRVLHRINTVAPSALPPGPLQPATAAAVEHRLIDHVTDLGWSPTDVHALLPPLTNAADPAHDPSVLQRIEALLDIIELELRPDTQRQTLSTLNELPHRQTLSAPSELPHRQTSSTPNELPDRQTLSTLPRTRRPDRRIHLQLPPPVLQHWHETAHRLRLHLSQTAQTPQQRAEAGPNGRFIPDATVLVLILHTAQHEWLLQDPAQRPRETAVLERDGWHCAAPGCSARRNLEVHHIRFRSRGGPDTPDNKITLCHGHHRQGIHENRAALTGAAPAHLHWRLGSPESTHITTYRGHLRTAPPLP